MYLDGVAENVMVVGSCWEGSQAFKQQTAPQATVTVAGIPCAGSLQVDALAGQQSVLCLCGMLKHTTCAVVTDRMAFASMQVQLVRWPSEQNLAGSLPVHDLALGNAALCTQMCS